MSHPASRLHGVDKLLGPSFLATLPPGDQPIALEALAAWSDFRVRRKTALNGATATAFRTEVKDNATLEMIAGFVVAGGYGGTAKEQTDAYARETWTPTGARLDDWQTPRLIAAVARRLAGWGPSPAPALILGHVSAYFDWQVTAGVLASNPGFR